MVLKDMHIYIFLKYVHIQQKFFKNKNVHGVIYVVSKMREKMVSCPQRDLNLKRDKRKSQRYKRCCIGPNQDSGSPPTLYENRDLPAPKNCQIIYSLLVGRLASCLTTSQLMIQLTDVKSICIEGTFNCVNAVLFFYSTYLIDGTSS